MILLLGPLLIEPVLLFATLYFVGSRDTFSVPLVSLIPGLIGAIVVGNLLGQYVGSVLLPGADVPLAWVVNHLFVFELGTIPFWRNLLEPLVRALLTAVAALAFARNRLG